MNQYDFIKDPVSSGEPSNAKWWLLAILATAITLAFCGNTSLKTPIQQSTVDYVAG